MFDAKYFLDIGNFLVINLVLLTLPLLLCLGVSILSHYHFPY